MSTVDFLVADVDVSALTPSTRIVERVAKHLSPEHLNAGFASLSGLQNVFEDLGLSAFRGIQDDGIPQSTLYLERLLRGVLQRLGSPKVTTKYLTFNGFGKIRSDDKATLRYGAFGSRKKYYYSSRIGIERAIEGLSMMDRCAPVREAYFAEARVEAGYESTKVPHLDPYPGIGALQKFVTDISGGHSQIYDVGRFCNEKKLHPWDVLMLHSPNPAFVFGEGNTPPFIPYNAFVPKPEYVEELRAAYQVAQVEDPSEILVFNNMISRRADGSYFCITHGANAPSASGDEPCRELSLSIAFPTIPVNDVRRLLEVVLS